MAEPLETAGDPFTVGGGFDQDACPGPPAEHRREAVGLSADALLDQFAHLRQDTDLTFPLVHVDANMVHGWPLLSAALTACALLWGNLCHHVEREASRFIPSSLPYLAVILDLCSRFAVGWAMSEHITDDVTLDALGMALARWRPPQGLLHHSDRGSQCASGDYQRLLERHGIVCSMSRRGDCWDNAVAESFVATLKVELVHDATWETRATACSELFDYIERFYNGQRRHSALGYLSPRGFQQRHQQALTRVSTSQGQVQPSREGSSPEM